MRRSGKTHLRKFPDRCSGKHSTASVQLLFVEVSLDGWLHSDETGKDTDAFSHIKVRNRVPFRNKHADQNIPYWKVGSGHYSL